MDKKKNNDCRAKTWSTGGGDTDSTLSLDSEASKSDKRSPTPLPSFFDESDRWNMISNKLHPRCWQSASNKPNPPPLPCLNGEKSDHWESEFDKPYHSKVPVELDRPRSPRVHQNLASVETHSGCSRSSVDDAADTPQTSQSNGGLMFECTINPAYKPEPSECEYLTPIVEVLVGGNDEEGKRYMVHEGVLARAPALSARRKGQWATTPLYLHEVVPSLFEIVLTYLYKGDYPVPAPRYEGRLGYLGTTFKTHAQVYCLATEFEIESLVEITTRRMIGVGELEFSSVIAIAKEVYPKLQDNDVWFPSYVKKEMSKALTSNLNIAEEHWALEIYKKGGKLAVDLLTTFFACYKTHVVKIEEKNVQQVTGNPVLSVGSEINPAESSVGPCPDGAAHRKLELNYCAWCQEDDLRIFNDSNKLKTGSPTSPANVKDLLEKGMLPMRKFLAENGVKPVSTVPIQSEPIFPLDTASSGSKVSSARIPTAQDVDSQHSEAMRRDEISDSPSCIAEKVGIKTSQNPKVVRVDIEGFETIPEESSSQENKFSELESTKKAEEEKKEKHRVEIEKLTLLIEEMNSGSEKLRRSIEMQELRNKEMGLKNESWELKIQNLKNDILELQLKNGNIKLELEQQQLKNGNLKLGLEQQQLRGLQQENSEENTGIKAEKGKDEAKKQDNGKKATRDCPTDTDLSTSESAYQSTSEDDSENETVLSRTRMDDMHEKNGYKMKTASSMYPKANSIKEHCYSQVENCGGFSNGHLENPLGINKDHSNVAYFEDLPSRATWMPEKYKSGLSEGAIDSNELSRLMYSRDKKLDSSVGGVQNDAWDVKSPDLGTSGIDGGYYSNWSKPANTNGNEGHRSKPAKTNGYGDWSKSANHNHYGGDWRKYLKAHLYDDKGTEYAKTNAYTGDWRTRANPHIHDENWTEYANANAYNGNWSTHANANDSQDDNWSMRANATDCDIQGTKSATNKEYDDDWKHANLHIYDDQWTEYAKAHGYHDHWSTRAKANDDEHEWTKSATPNLYTDI